MDQPHRWRLTVTGGNYSSTTSPPFASLSDIDGSSLYVSGGGSLTLPAVTSYIPSGQDVSFSASGTGSGNPSTLSLPNLTLIGTTVYDGGELTIQATSGGQVLVPALTTINTAGDYATVSAEADGSGSLIDLSGLTTYDIHSDGQLSAIDNGEVLLNTSLTTLNGVTIVLDGTGTLAVGQLTSVTDGGITVEAGDYNTAFPILSDIDGSSLSVYGGGSLDLPGVTTYTNWGAPRLSRRMRNPAPTPIPPRWARSACSI